MFEFNPSVSSEVHVDDASRRAPEAVPDAAAAPGGPAGPLSAAELDLLNRYWQAANYLTVGQIYLAENPLLRRALSAADIKPRLLGHWGTSPAQNFIYLHLNRLIRKHDAAFLYIAGPGHGGPALNAQSYLEGSYSEVHPEITQDEAGMRALFRSFSTKNGVPSHCGPHVPNSIHEGGELGYSLLHAQGAAFDNPDLIVACVIGDGEAETGALATSWRGVEFLNPVTDGAVLPILNLNGYKIAGPTLFGRSPDSDLIQFFHGLGYRPVFVEGADIPVMHQRFAEALDECYHRIRAIQHRARKEGLAASPGWPLIVLRSPKGWTGPHEVDGIPVEGTFRAHQVPLANVRERPEHLALLEAWMKSYRPDELFDARGRLVEDLAALAPRGELRMGATAHANGGRILEPLVLPDPAGYALDVPARGAVAAEAPRKLGAFLRDVISANPARFLLFCPDETDSNRLSSVFETTVRRNLATLVNIDDHVGPDGRVFEILSEHCCEGWLEGYLLTGRHGLFVSYEAFAQVVDSMVTQHAKWLEQCQDLPWREPIASLNVFLSSHVWRSDHNGFSHQAPGFVDNALARRKAVIHVYYPPDSNSLIHVMNLCLQSRDHVNVVTCGKQSELQWLDFDAAARHCELGASAWDFVSNVRGDGVDVVLACVGDVPTLETCAAAWLLRKWVPEFSVRVVNIVDLEVLIDPHERERGLSPDAFAALFGEATPVIFAHHGYPWSIHSLVHGRPHEGRFHVHGFMDRGTTTTPFDMTVMNGISRYHLALAAMTRAARKPAGMEAAVAYLQGQLQRHESYIAEHLEDMPEIVNWYWTDDGREPDAPAPLASQTARGNAFTDA